MDQQINPQVNESAQSSKNVWAIIALAVIVVIIVGGGVYWWQKIIEEKSTEESTPEPVDETADWKSYRNEGYGFEIRYPGDILQLDEKGAALSHTLSSFHKYSSKDGSDLGLAEDITVVFRKETDECEDMEKSLKDIALPFEFGNVKGLKYETGAEGKGVIYYCVRNDENKNIFLIERWFLSEAYAIELQKQEDYISSKGQEEVFNQILSTLKFIE